MRWYNWGFDRGIWGLDWMQKAVFRIIGMSRTLEFLTKFLGPYPGFTMRENSTGTLSKLSSKSPDI